MSVLFYYVATTRLFSSSAPGAFVFTNENFYIKNGGKIKYSDIVGVSYREELKKSFLVKKNGRTYYN